MRTRGVWKTKVLNNFVHLKQNYFLGEPNKEARSSKNYALVNNLIIKSLAVDMMTHKKHGKLQFNAVHKW